MQILPVTLAIKGVVIPSEKIEDVYHFSIGLIKIEDYLRRLWRNL